jgi:hypothetical protein
MFPSLPGPYATKSHKNDAQKTLPFQKVYLLLTENVKIKEYIG